MESNDQAQTDALPALELLDLLKQPAVENSQFYRQLWAVTYTRGLHFMREWHLFVTLFIPLLFTLAVFLFAVAQVRQTRAQAREDVKDQALFETVSKYASSVTAVLFSLWIVLGFAVSTAIFIDGPVRDRELGLRALLHGMGMRVSAYWLGNMTGDIVLFLASSIGFIAFI